MFNLKNQIIYSVIFTIMWWVISHVINSWPKTTLHSSTTTTPVAESATMESVSSFISDLKEIPQ